MKIRHTTTPRLEVLREEVRDWLADELPKKYEGFIWTFEEDPDQWAFYRTFWRKQGAKGWLEPGWPKEYGGLEFSRRYCELIREEFGRRRAGAIGGIGSSVGPNILRLGTAEQKKFFLPAMAAGEILWAEGFTEPDSGSDLASLRTRAEKDGDEWVITGTKTFGTGAHQCDWMAIFARTDPDYEKRHRGLSCFLSPIDAPGLEFRPLYNIASGRQNITNLDEVHVPADRMLGDLNRGWAQIWFGLEGEPLPVYEDDDPGPEMDYEPPITGLGTVPGGQQAWILNELVQHCHQTMQGDRPMIEDPVIRLKLAQLAVGVEIGRVLEYEGTCPYGGHHLHSAISKEFEPRFAQECMEILGPLGQIQSGPLAALEGEIDRIYRQSFGNHGGGTSQLKRMVVATRALGLPR